MGITALTEGLKQTNREWERINSNAERSLDVLGRAIPQALSGAESVGQLSGTGAFGGAAVTELQRMRRAVDRLTDGIARSGALQGAIIRSSR